MTANKAPPSNLAKIVDVPFAHKALVEKYSPVGRYIDAMSDGWRSRAVAICRFDCPAS